MSDPVEIGRVGREWLSLLRTEALVCSAFGLSWPLGEDDPALPKALALLDLGLCVAEIVQEPRFRLSAKKQARDAMLQRDTIHMAPTWRYADRDEAGRKALILPVGTDEQGHLRPMSVCQSQSDGEFASWIADLVAIPLDGKRPLSSTGHTLAVGCFQVDGSTLRLYAGAMEWLRAYIARVTPEHLHTAPPAPDYSSTLLIEALGLEWRVRSWNCVIPEAARTVAVMDSARLAELIDQRMRMPDRVRPMPTVCGPKVPA